MMKSWADHCSSDDEEDLAERTSAVLNVSEEDQATLKNKVPHNESEYHQPATSAAASEDLSPPSHSQGGGRRHPEDFRDSGSNRNSFRDGPRGEGRGGGGGRGRGGGGKPYHHDGPREYSFPTEPPYTAFVGNLSFGIQENDDLANELVAIAKDVLGLDLVITECRIMRHRDDPDKHRGFAYVQVETLDMLKGLMELNAKPVELLGRTLQLDTAEQQSSHKNNNRDRRGSNFDRHSGPPNSGDVDGSQFRGGRYNNRDGGRPSRGSGTASSFSSPTGATDDGAAATPPTSDGPPPQRPSLKLQPRTVGASTASGSVGAHAETSSPSIFGGGKARNEGDWRSRKSQTQQPPGSGDAKSSSLATSGAGANHGGASSGSHPRHSDAKGRGFGGRGSGGGGRGGTGGDAEGPDFRRRSGRGGGEGSEPGRGFEGGRRQSGRGTSAGAGRGAAVPAAAGGTSGEHKPHKERKEKAAKTAPAAAGAATSAPVTPAVAPAPEPEAKKPVNKFAALMDDSDSE